VFFDFERQEIPPVLGKAERFFFAFGAIHTPPMEISLHKTLISALELKRLMVDLKEKRPNICIRFRLLGEMWIVSFMQVMSISERGVLLFDESNNLVSLNDLNFVMQFEIDKPFQAFQPYYHYEVAPSYDF
jgi:hypothetical protein